MLVRLVVGRVDDELIDGLGACRLGLAHRSTPPSATLSSRTRPRFMGTAVRDLLFAPAVWRVLIVRPRPPPHCHPEPGPVLWGRRRGSCFSAVRSPRQNPST